MDYQDYLSDFCRNTKDAYEKCQYPYAPFIPYVLDAKAYNDAPLKVFYVGIDTLGWNPIEKLFGIETQLEKYLSSEGKVVNCDSLKHNGNNCGCFWKFVQKLHLRLTMDISISDLSSLDEKQRKCIGQIGYGNLFALEQGVCKGIEDKVSLKIIQRYAAPFEHIKNILDVFRPNIIIILGWKDKKSLWAGVKENLLFYEENQKGRMGKAVFSIDNYDTMVMWFPHPRYLNRNFNLDSCIDDIVNTWKGISLI